jgi:hypothetical protein
VHIGEKSDAHSRDDEREDALRYTSCSLESMHHAWARSAAAATVATIAVSTTLLVGAMLVYPGGTQWEHAREGHDFWRNYLCDLARTVALNGRPNPVGSALARSAMVVLAAGLASFFWLLPRLFASRRRVSFGVRTLGCFAACGGCTVALLPADQVSEAHGIAIVVAGVAGLAAASLAVTGLLREERAPPIAAAAGVCALLLASVAFALFVRQFVVAGPGPVAGAAFERLALLSLVAWMGVVAWRARVR